MERKLKALFEFQRFQKNERLERLTDSIKKGSVIELDDEQLSRVSAAGDPFLFEEKKKNSDNEGEQ